MRAHEVEYRTKKDGLPVHVIATFRTDHAAKRFAQQIEPHKLIRVAETNVDAEFSDWADKPKVNHGQS